MLSAPKANLYTQVSITVTLQRKIQINLKMDVKSLSSMGVLREGGHGPLPLKEAWVRRRRFASRGSL